MEFKVFTRLEKTGKSLDKENRENEESEKRLGH